MAANYPVRDKKGKRASGDISQLGVNARRFAAMTIFTMAEHLLPDDNRHRDVGVC
jgi:hypothetical protein